MMMTSICSTCKVKGCPYRGANIEGCTGHSILAMRLKTNESKFGAERKWSGLCCEFFASKGEAEYAEQLRIRELAGEISELTYHVVYTLSKKPKVTIEVDFRYKENGQVVHEDFKGHETRDYRTKRIWLEQQQGILIKLIRDPGRKRKGR